MPGPRDDPLAVLDRAVAGLGGDDRPGQRELAGAVATAIEAPHHLLAEAPTGSGKSLAYLAPVLASGARAVVATATLALQDQLWRKDLPHLREHGGVEFTTALLKGRSNYVCLSKLKAAHGDDALFDERPSEAFRADLERLDRFAAGTGTGDIADLGDAVSLASARLVTCAPHECHGASKCEQGADCFAELARQRAEDVDVLVVNHALYCANLATGGVLLPEHDVVIFDEAHVLDRTATGALGTDLSGGGLRQLAGRLRRAGAPAAIGDALQASATTVDEALGDVEGRVDPTDGRLADVLDTLGQQLADAGAAVGRGAQDAAALQAVRLTSARLEAVRRLREPAAGEVVWVDGGDRPMLRLAPIVIGKRLAPLLFARVPTVLVSATLGPGARFEPLARGLGLDADATPGIAEVGGDGDPDRAGEGDGPGRGYVALRVDSPFDFRHQAMLYVPRDLPDPRDAGWSDASAAELCGLVESAGGRALVLCTSWRAVDAFAAVLRDRTDHPVIVQGSEPTPRLIERFTAEESSCLVATRAFWMGLDVPGPACVLVVIDRLPFTRPNEPLEQARREAVEEAGGDGFRDIDLPAAALVLAQGAGRLIRHRDDRGVVAVLDRRLATAGYRKVLLDALPPMRRSVDGEEVRAFLRTVVQGDDVQGDDVHGDDGAGPEE